MLFRSYSFADDNQVIDVAYTRFTGINSFFGRRTKEKTVSAKLICSFVLLSFCLKDLIPAHASSGFTVMEKIYGKILILEAIMSVLYGVDF